MKLHYSPTSPYVRKVLVVAHEKGIADRIEIQRSSPWEENDLTKDNPIGKIPALVADDGRVLFDSRVICEYLDALAGGTPLYPSGADRWLALRMAALGDGILEAGVAISIERRQDEAHWSDWHIGRQKEKINRTINALEAEVDSLEGPLTIGQITVGAALSYVDFRDFVGDWRPGRPKLAAWHARFADRPSMQATEHKE